MVVHPKDSPARFNAETTRIGPSQKRRAKPSDMLSAMAHQELIEKIKRTHLRQALANYAIQHAGTEADLVPGLGHNLRVDGGG